MERSLLSEREIAVLELVARGLSNRAIGAALFISEATVKYHLHHVFQKLGASDRTEAAVLALRQGLIQPDSRRASDPPKDS